MSSRKRATQVRHQLMRNLNAIFALPKMTPEQERTLQELRTKVHNKQITVKQAHEIWRQKYGER